MSDPRPQRQSAGRRAAPPHSGKVSELRRVIPVTPDGRDGSSGQPDRLPEDLTVAVRETGTTIRIVGSGEWDLAQCEAVHDAIREALERSPECVLLDLSQLAFIDSSGIHNVLELQGRCAQQHIHLVIMPAPPAVHRTFEISGLADLLPFVGSEPWPAQPQERTAAFRPVERRPGAQPVNTTPDRCSCALEALASP